MFGHMFLILVDAYSGYTYVAVMKSITTAKTIDVLRQKFADFGLPDTLVSDNATTFKSREMVEFCKRNGICQLFSPIFHPQSNGRAERAVQSFKSKLTKFGNVNLQLQVDKFMFWQHTTPVFSVSPCKTSMST
jgi:transposase InsO family protein